MFVRKAGTKVLLVRDIKVVAQYSPSCALPPYKHGPRNSRLNTRIGRSCPDIEMGVQVAHPRSLFPSCLDRWSSHSIPKNYEREPPAYRVHTASSTVDPLTIRAGESALTLPPRNRNRLSVLFRPQLWPGEHELRSLLVPRRMLRLALDADGQSVNLLHSILIISLSPACAAWKESRRRNALRQ